MRYRSELEALATLDAATIAAVCEDHGLIPSAIDRCVVEFVTFDELADAARDDDDDDRADFCRQEAAAWRATVTTLRRLRSAGASEQMPPRRIDGAA